MSWWSVQSDGDGVPMLTSALISSLLLLPSFLLSTLTRPYLRGWISNCRVELPDTFFSCFNRYLNLFLSFKMVLYTVRVFYRVFVRFTNCPSVDSSGRIKRLTQIDLSRMLGHPCERCSSQGTLFVLAKRELLI